MQIMKWAEAIHRVRKGYPDLVPFIGVVTYPMPEKVPAVPEKVPAVPEKVRVVPEKVPAQFRALAKTVSDYYRNLINYIEPASFVAYGRGTYNVRLVPLEVVANLLKLGEGHYSDVYEIDENYALKIVKSGDSGYSRFVKAIRETNNEHFPTVYYSGEWGGKQVYILEKLSCYPATLTIDVCNSIRYIFRDGLNPNPYVTAAPSIQEAVSILQKQDLTGDLHEANMMWRGDCPVVTDPCSD